MKKLIIFLLAITLIALLCWLGFWQLHRADEKKAMLAHHMALRTVFPMLLNSQHKSDKNIKKIKIENYQPIQVKGSYDNRHVFFLDNQFYQHQLGYEVINPVFLSDGKVILVSRGWIKAPQDRQKAPKIIVPKEYQQIITGTAYFPSKSLIVWGNNNQDSFSASQEWPKRLEKIDVSEILQWLEEEVHHTLQIYPFILRLSASEPDGFVRDWAIVSMPPERHIGYAVQWFGMALTVFIIFIVLTFKNRKKTT